MSRWIFRRCKLEHEEKYSGPRVMALYISQLFNLTKRPVEDVHCSTFVRMLSASHREVALKLQLPHPIRPNILSTYPTPRACPTQLARLTL